MRRRIKQLGALICVVLLLIAACRLLLPRDRQLLQEVHVVRDLNGRKQTITTVHWLTPSRFLVFQWDLNLWRVCSDVTSYDLTARRSVPMPKLLNALKQAQVNSDNLLISPDARYVLASGVDSHKVCTNYIFMLDGKRVNVDAVDATSPALWLPDSKHWVTLHWIGGDTEKLSGRYRNATDSTDIPLPELDVPGGVFNMMACYTYVSQAGDNLLVCKVPQNGAATDCSLIRLAVGKTLRLVASSQAKFPHGSHINQVVISPGGDRIAWSLICHIDSHLNQLLRRFFPSPAFKPRDYLAIYLSRSDGTELRELGSVRWQGARQRINFLGGMLGRFTPWSEPDIQNLEWTPDGANISFTYHNRLYLLPVK